MIPGIIVGIVAIVGVLAATIAARSFERLAPSPAAPVVRNATPAPAWGSNIRTRTLLQQPIESLGEGDSFVLRVTELEMEPKTRIFDHQQIGPGVHYVVKGNITIEHVDPPRIETYQAGQAYFEGPGPLHRAANLGAAANRVLMFDILPATRGFDGTQRFTTRGRHNEGELRSGPYGQMPLRHVPNGPLVLRLTEMQFGPKAKTVEHVRLGPMFLFVAEGTAHIRKDWANTSLTYGTDGYVTEHGREPFILENKPATPARFIVAELLPASVGNGPSTIPTDGEESDD